MKNNQCKLCFKEDRKLQEETRAGLVNLITDYAIENKMSVHEIDKCVEHVKEVYYKDAIIKR
ncbi:hypothetical protein WS9_009540 [Paraclostridium sordellii 8483]|uniref:hypothetical protein n=1 Tax=Paraclostridium sordellii TaxID=1505 RepID=UPI0003047553|nr:hypothetical protein [Paeniclostridium sordellii]TAN66812.1 hypothetical protein WS9_009540 [Paeniclostridium sordellii 8483]